MFMTDNEPVMLSTSRERPARAGTEAGRLSVRPGALVLTIARTYRTDERPVETADIVIPLRDTP